MSAKVIAKREARVYRGVTEGQAVDMEQPPAIGGFADAISPSGHAPFPAPFIAQSAHGVFPRIERFKANGDGHQVDGGLCQ